jgi:F1F0 ATPase subunit 2
MGYELPHLILAFIAGIAIGIFYFAGLWWTVQRLPSTQRPALLPVASFIGRTFVTALAFYLVMDGSWQRLLVSLLGFVVARALLTRRLKPSPGTTARKVGQRWN